MDEIEKAVTEANKICEELVEKIVENTDVVFNQGNEKIVKKIKEVINELKKNKKSLENMALMLPKKECFTFGKIFGVLHVILKLLSKVVE